MSGEVKQNTSVASGTIATAPSATQSASDPAINKNPEDALIVCSGWQGSSNIEDTKFNHYALQLSLYRYLLEEYYNLKISQHLIVHLKDEQCIGLHVPYMKNNIIQMVQSTMVNGQMEKRKD